MALKNVHIKLCGAHMSSIVLAHQILRVGYCWPIIEYGACEFSKVSTLSTIFKFYMSSGTISPPYHTTMVIFMLGF